MFTLATTTKPSHKTFLPGHTHKKFRAKPGHSSKVRSVLRGILDNREINKPLSTAQDLKQNRQQPREHSGNDAYEQEADRVADHVMRKPLCEHNDRQSQTEEDFEAPGNTAVQAKGALGASCSSAPDIGEEEENTSVQKKSRAGAGREVTPEFSRQLKQQPGSGDKLPLKTRQDMEARFGHSFSQVRIHTDAHAVKLTQQLNAEAFATGNDIYLNAGRYNPDSFSGKWLLAHELTHVLQQRKSSGKRVGSMPISNVGATAVQSYKLKGFPPAKAAQMHAAIATAIATVSGCSYLTWLGKLLIKTALRRMRYDYVPDLGLCGWTFPASWYIEIGEKAFDHAKCCDLASTLAHEASHTEWYTEGRARKMECKCFGCSC